MTPGRPAPIQGSRSFVALAMKIAMTRQPPDGYDPSKLRGGREIADRILADAHASPASFADAPQEPSTPASYGRRRNDASSPT
jgi:hypothetical protein